MTASGTMKIRIWVAFVVTLLSGVAIGFAMGSFVFRGTPAAMPSGAVASKGVALKGGGKSVQDCSVMRHRLLDRFSQELDLTPEQQAKVKPVLEKMTAEIDAIHKGKRPEIRKAIADCMAEMKAMLTPDQGVKLQNLEKRMSDGGCGVGRGKGSQRPGEHRGSGRKKAR